MGRASKNSPNTEYYIELKPAVVEAYFAFCTPRKEGKREISADDFNRCVRAFGNELYRGSAAIYDTDFSFSLDQG